MAVEERLLLKPWTWVCFEWCVNDIKRPQLSGVVRMDQSACHVERNSRETREKTFTLENMTGILMTKNLDS